MALLRPTEEERIALCEWLTSNGVDPNNVPMHSRLFIGVADDGTKTIHYDEYVLTEDGHKQISPGTHDYAPRRAATTPCTVEPPAWLRVPGAAS